MIEFKKVPQYQTSDGQGYPTLQAAQAAELVKLLGPNDETDTPWPADKIANKLIAYSGQVVAILKQKERVRTRKPKEGKKRTAKPATSQVAAAV